jgi:hypothetical protein
MMKYHTRIENSDHESKHNFIRRKQHHEIRILMTCVILQIIQNCIGNLEMSSQILMPLGHQALSDLVMTLGNEPAIAQCQLLKQQW